MQQLNELNAIVGECDRVIDGMLNGRMSRDDGLFAATAALRKVAIEFTQFVAYALPILHTINQAMQAAQAQTAQMQAAQMQAAQAVQPPPTAAPVQGTTAPQEAPPSNVVPINAGGEIQQVDGTPGARR